MKVPYSQRQNIHIDKLMDTAYLLRLILCAACKKYERAKYKVIIRNHMSEGRAVTWTCYVSYAEVSDTDAVSHNYTLDNFKSADVNNAVFRIFWNL